MITIEEKLLVHMIASPKELVEQGYLGGQLIHPLYALDLLDKAPKLHEVAVIYPWVHPQFEGLIDSLETHLWLVSDWVSTNEMYYAKKAKSQLQNRRFSARSAFRTHLVENLKRRIPKLEKLGKLANDIIDVLIIPYNELNEDEKVAHERISELIDYPSLKKEFEEEIALAEAEFEPQINNPRAKPPAEVNADTLAYLQKRRPELLSFYKRRRTKLEPDESTNYELTNYEKV